MVRPPARLGYELGFNSNLVRPSNLRYPESDKSIKTNYLERLYIRIFGLPDIIKQQQSREFFSIIDTLDFSDVLDIGCAQGHYSIRIAKNYLKSFVIGIDINETKIKTAKQTSTLFNIRNTLFKKTDLIEYNTHNKFDLVLLLQVLEHLKEDLKALKKIRGLIKKNGFLIITVPNKNSEIIKWLKKHTYINSHERDGYTTEELKKLFTKADFKIIKIKYLSGFIGRYIEKIESFLKLNNLYLFCLMYPFINLMMFLDDAVIFKSEKSTSGILILATPT